MASRINTKREADLLPDGTTGSVCCRVSCGHPVCGPWSTWPRCLMAYEVQVIITQSPPSTFSPRCHIQFVLPKVAGLFLALGSVIVQEICSSESWKWKKTLTPPAWLALPRPRLFYQFSIFQLVLAQARGSITREGKESARQTTRGSSVGCVVEFITGWKKISVLLNWGWNEWQTICFWFYFKRNSSELWLTDWEILKKLLIPRI